MTEEIIIDGVNVAGCKYHDDGICCNDDVFTLSCEKTNCMYKQFKRLEQENKELKEKVKSRENELANMAEQANMRINTYRSALEEIREIAKDICKNDVYENSDAKAEKILDKINEVLK